MAYPKPTCFLRQVLSATLCVISLAALGQNINDNLLIKYEFNGNANDISGNGFHGIVNATLATDRNGVPNACYFFNGTTDYIDFPNVSTLKPGLPVSLSFWVNFSSLKPGVLTTDFAQDIHTGVWVALNSEGRIAFSYGDGGLANPTSRRTKIGDTRLQTGIWYHILGVVRGPNDMDIFINGIDDCGVYTGSGNSITYSSSPGSIGRKDANPSLPPYYFHGYIDDFYYWNRSVSVDEIYSTQEIGDSLTNILSFEVPGQIEPATIDTYDKVITLTIECSRSLELIATFALAENAKAYVNSIEQTSGSTMNDFTSPVIYRINNRAGCTEYSTDWTIIVTKETLPPAIADGLTSFTSITIEGQTKPVAIDSANNLILFEVNCAADVNNLALSFTLPASTVFLANGSGFSSGALFNFANPLAVVLQNDSVCSSQNWTISVTRETTPPAIADGLTSFTSITIEDQSKPVILDTANHLILFEVICAANISNLSLHFALPANTTFLANGTTFVSGEQFNFTGPLLVTLQNDSICSSQSWTIEVRQRLFSKEEIANEKDFFIPNIITPNRDNKNEYFVLGDLLLGSTLTIVNRYGTPVYTSASYQNDFNGRNLAPGVYYYAIDFSCYKDLIKGTLTILK